jgi:hypothetical protein
MRHAFLALLILAGLTPVLAGDSDRIERKGASPASGYVIRETPDQLWYTQSKEGRPTPIKQSDISRIVFRFQVIDGFWTKAGEARDRGRYEEAAELYGSLSAAGTREPEIVYGAFAEGEMWEQAGRFDLAAKAYAKITGPYGPKYALPEPGKLFKPKDEELPHKLWNDARAREGMCLGLAKDAGAKAVADDLTSRGKAINLPELETRGRMVEAAILAGNGDLAKFGDACRKVIVSPNERAYIHFNLFRADNLRRLGDLKNAAAAYRGMTDNLGDDAAVTARVRLGLGLALVESDPARALPELAALDALPYGSPDQKCVARWHVGRLMFEESKKMKADPAKAVAGGDLERAARLVLDAAANADSKVEEKAKAKALLDEITAADAPAAEAKPAEAAPAADKKPAIGMP